VNAITDQPSIGWLMVVVAVWTVAIGFVLFVLAIVGPELWRAMREWFAPVRVDNVVSMDERRRQLGAASGWTRDL
jgi:hypothetical protein